MIPGPTVSLRPFDRGHLGRTRDWVNHPELSRLLGRAVPVSDAEHERWFAAARAARDRVMFAIETNARKRHVGNIWLCNIDWRHRKAELRIVIGDAASTDRGLGTEAIGLLSAYARERLNLHRIYAYVLGTNPRALRAFEKAGFAVEGVLKDDRWSDGRYVDAYVVGRIMR
jgi:RimJ/RimL family protein N-acetyltransferase